MEKEDWPGPLTGCLGFHQQNIAWVLKMENITNVKTPQRCKTALASQFSSHGQRVGNGVSLVVNYDVVSVGGER